MTQTRTGWLLTTRAVSCGPWSGWAGSSGYLDVDDVCLARTMTAIAALPSDNSYCYAACRPTARERIEYRGTRRMGDANDGVASRHGSLVSNGASATEFISARRWLCSAPMNRSLGWGSSIAPRVGRVANFGHSIFTH